MGVIRFAINNPTKIAVGVILLVLFGLLSMFHIGVQLTPDVDRPIITVQTNWTGASPQEIETEIVDRQEEKLKNVSDLLKMTATCSEGRAAIKLEFPVGVDKDIAFRNVSDKLRQVSDYPDEVDEPVVTPTDDDMEQTIAWLILTSREGQDVSKLKTFIEDHVKPILERADGISEVPVYGGLDREIQIEIDAFKLAARGLTFRDVERALRGQNTNISAGTVAQGKLEYTYRTIGEYATLEAIENTVIAYQPGGPVLIRDVARAIDGFKKPVSFVRSKGRAVMALPARRNTGANVIVAMSNLRKQIEIVNREILGPLGLNLELTQVYDETTYIWSAIGLVVKNIFLGGFLAIAVLVLFLRSGSATGIIAVAIPVSVIGTFVVIQTLDRSLNVVLLAGMAFAVGMVVDNAIVVLENIYRHRFMGKTSKAAAMDGATEVWGAVLASTLTTMAVFLPVITIQEEAGQLFKDIAIAIASAVGLSLVVSVLLIPPLAARLFGGSGNTPPGGTKAWRVASRVSSLVGFINKRHSRRIAVVLGFSATAILGGWALMPATEYLPAGNKNLVFGFLSSPPGYSIDEFRRMAKIVEDGDPNDPTDGIRPFWDAELDSLAASQLPSVTIPLGKKGDITRVVTPPPIENFFYVSFNGGAFMGCTSKNPNNVKPLEQVLTASASRVPGVFSMFNQASLFRTGGRRGGNTVDIEVRGNIHDEVVSSASAIRRKIQELAYPRPSATPENFALGAPEIQLIPDRAKAADLGLDVRDVGFIVRACVDGAFVDEYNDHGNRLDMVLKVADMEHADMRAISQVPLYTPSGHIVTLDSAVELHRTTAPQQITHIEEMDSVTLSVQSKTGVPLQETMIDLETEVLAPLRASGQIPSTVLTALAGTANKLTQTMRALVGDFRGLLKHPQFFGLPVAWSIVLLVGIVFALVLVAWLTAGPRIAIQTAVIGPALVIIAILVLNPALTLMAFQSRGLLAALVTYLLIAALFESFTYPFVIMLSVPLAAVGGVMALRIVHETSLYDVTTPIQQLDVLTMLGFVILVGIVVNNAILIVHQALTYMRRDDMEPEKAVALSVYVRTRPIVMSASTSVLGMCPLVIMPGAGSELYRGLGSVVLGGLVVSTVLTIIVIPAMFTLLIDFQRWIARLMATDTRRQVSPVPQPAATAASPSSPSRISG